MAIGINDFRSQFRGTRNNRFAIQLDLPSEIGNGNTLRLDLYGKATALPTASIGVIPVPWMGRVIKFSGERTFADWTIQLYDENAGGNSDIRNLMMKWIEAMNTAETHDIRYNIVSDAVIAWNDLQGGQGPTNHNNQSSWGKRVKLYNCFPIDVGELQLSYDNVDQFSEFPVTFAYDYWDYVGADGSAQTTGADSAQSSGQQSGLAPRR
jgi:hypothetical protein